MKNDIEYNDEIDFGEILSIILKGKYIVLSITTLGAIFSVILALWLPNVYTSSTLLAVANEKSSMSNKLSSYSSLAGLAGINISRDSNNSLEAIERIKSFDFFSKHFLPYIKLENLLAVDRWNEDNNLLTYNSKIFDNNTKKWIRKTNPTKPSKQEAYKVYKEILTISEDNKTFFVTISIKHKSPNVAKNWVEIIVKNINDIMRQEENKIITNSINFLTEKIATTNLKETKDAISQLIESQMQSLMIAAASESYVYKTLNAPIAPERKTSPNRALICIIGTILGGILGVMLAFYIHFKKLKN